MGLGLLLGGLGIGLGLWLERVPASFATDESSTHGEFTEVVAEEVAEDAGVDRHSVEWPSPERWQRATAYRDWTALDGRILRARAIGLRETEDGPVIRLQRQDDGEVFWVEKERLRLVDREFIRHYEAIWPSVNRDGLSDGPDGALTRAPGADWERYSAARAINRDWWPADAEWVDGVVLRDGSWLITGYLKRPFALDGRWKEIHWGEAWASENPVAGPFLLRTTPRGEGIEWAARWPQTWFRPTGLGVGSNAEVILSGRTGPGAARAFAGEGPASWHMARDLLMRVRVDGAGWTWARPAGLDRMVGERPVIDEQGRYVLVMEESWSGREVARLVALSAEDGRPLWRRRLAPEREGVIREGRLALLDDGGLAIAYQRQVNHGGGILHQAVIKRLDETGGERWVRRFPSEPGPSWLLVSGILQCPVTGEVIVLGEQRQKNIEELWPGWIPGDPEDRTIAWLGRFAGMDGRTEGTWFYPALEDADGTDWPKLLENRFTSARVDGQGKLWLTLRVSDLAGRENVILARRTLDGSLDKPLERLPVGSGVLFRWLGLSPSGVWWLEKSPEGGNRMRFWSFGD